MVSSSAWFAAWSFFFSCVTQCKAFFCSVGGFSVIQGVGMHERQRETEVLHTSVGLHVCMRE